MDKSKGVSKEESIPEIEENQHQGIIENTSPGNTHTPAEEFMSDSVLLSERKVIYDADFEPSISVTINNKMKFKIIAFQLIVDPNVGQRKNCETIWLTKKMDIPSGKSVTITERVTPIEDVLCPIDHATIQMGEFVLENGRKTNLQMLWWEQVSKKD